jgi:hypothetical protein
LEPRQAELPHGQGSPSIQSAQLGPLATRSICVRTAFSSVPWISVSTLSTVSLPVCAWYRTDGRRAVVVDRQVDAGAAPGVVGLVSLEDVGAGHARRR